LLRYAIVRPPASSFAEGLTEAGLGPPDLTRALAQHGAYCDALARCGLDLTRLEPEAAHPDSTFVEDTALLTPRGTILARPGEQARRGETAGMRPVLERLRGSVRAIRAPGTLDAGDVCETEHHFIIGISRRTNEEGARQLAALLEEDGYRSTPVDIRRVKGLLHLKSGLAHLGEGRLLAVPALAERPELHGYSIVRVEPGEDYAANSVLVNGHLLLAAGFPRTEAALRALGHSILPFEMSEFRKMDGGLSCLSLRY
jgi:dimethylargininase